MLESMLLCSGSHVNINTPVHGLPSVGRPVGAHVAVGEGEGEVSGEDGNSGDDGGGGGGGGGVEFVGEVGGDAVPSI